MPLLMSDLDDTLVERPPLFRRLGRARFLDDAGQPADLWTGWSRRTAGGHRPRGEFVRRHGRPASATTYRSSELPREHDDGARRQLPADRRGPQPPSRTAPRAGWRLRRGHQRPGGLPGPKVGATGLDELADAVCISEEVGVDKPDPLMFRTAAERAGTTLEGAWMIGDNLDADIAGAQGVGARSVWVEHDDEWLDLPLRHRARPGRRGLPGRRTPGAGRHRRR